jgi:hypothetical protein
MRPGHAQPQGHAEQREQQYEPERPECQQGRPDEEDPQDQRQSGPVNLKSSIAGTASR